MNFAFLTADPNTAAAGGMATSLISLLMIIAVFYFFILRPQQRRDKEASKMRSNLRVGDDVITIGGIVGTIVSMKEDTLVIETGSDRSKIRVTRWAIQQNTTPKDSK
ncbi:MAG: preprotein translocase subunit YajC [Angelakisella sp.]|jgi:preprotein translocase subunit YajC|nr:preprotein translocase subunit YajC [Angelakisella sp.]